MHQHVIIVISVVSMTYSAVLDRINKLQEDSNLFIVPKTDIEAENKEKHGETKLQVNDFKPEASAYKKLHGIENIDEIFKPDDTVNYKDKAVMDARTKWIADEVNLGKDSTTYSVDTKNSGDVLGHDTPLDEELPEHRRVKSQEVSFIFDDCPGKEVYKFIDGTLFCTEDDGGPYIIEITDRYNFGTIKCANNQTGFQFGKEIICVDRNKTSKGGKVRETHVRQ